MEAAASFNSQEFMVKCLNAAQFSPELVEDIAGACELAGFTALSLAKNELSLSAISSKLFLTAEEARDLLAACQQLTGKPCELGLLVLTVGRAGTHKRCRAYQGVGGNAWCGRCVGRTLHWVLQRPTLFPLKFSTQQLRATSTGITPQLRVSVILLLST